MDRRNLLAGLAASVTAALLTACDTGTDDAPHSTHPSPSSSSSAPKPTPTHTAPPRPVFAHVPIPTTHMIDKVPVGGSKRQMALTIDDGVDSEVVAGYAKLCHDTGLRMTFFANGCYRSWSDNAKALRPLIESGQVVIGNHTYNHPALTTLTDSQIAWQMTTNEKVLSGLFGKTTKPFMRPPYGHINNRVITTLHHLGYTGVTYWLGTLGDDQIITPAQVMSNARTWMTPGRLVVGHANHPAVTHCYDKLIELIHTRNLTTVTVADVYH